MSDQTTTPAAPEAPKKVTAAEIDFSTAANFKYKERIPAANARKLDADRQIALEDGSVVDAKAGDRVVINARDELRHFSEADWNARFEIDGSDDHFFRRREGGQLKWVKEPTIFVADNGKETLVAPGGAIFFSFADQKVAPFQPDELKKWFARLFKDNTEIDLSELAGKQTLAAVQADDRAHLKDISDVTGVTGALNATKDFATQGMAEIREGLGQIRKNAPQVRDDLLKRMDEAGNALGKAGDTAINKGRELSQKVSRFFGRGKGPGSSGPTPPA